MTGILLGLAVVGVLDTLLRLPYLRNFDIGWIRVLTIALSLALGWCFVLDPLDALAAIGVVVILEKWLSAEPPAQPQSLDYRTDLQEKPPRVTPPG